MAADRQAAPIVPVDDDHTVPRVLVDQAQRVGAKPLFVADAGQAPLRYADLADRAEWASTRLADELGIAPRSSAAVFLPNGPDFVVSSFACLFGGIVDFPVNPEYRKGLLAHALEVSGAQVAFTDAAGLEALLDPEIAAARARLRLVVLCGGDGERVGDTKRRLAGTAVLPLAELASEGRRNGRWCGLRATDLASIRFTSGTTGKAKGIMHSHLHMLGKSMAINRILEADRDDVLYSPFPLHHNLSSINGLLGMLQVGGTMVSAERFSASRYWDAARAHRATLGHILGPMIPMLLAQPARPADREHRVRFLWTARGSREFVERFGAQPVQAYALSEVGVIAYRKDGGEEGSTACGMPLPEMEVSIVDDIDRPQAPGTSGQIVIRPRHAHRMTLGYFADLPATVRAFRNLWYHTGDAGHIAADGQLHFEGRLGDTIRRRGVNISSEQLELEVGRDADVESCMALGVPSGLGDEDIHLLVTFRAGGGDIEARLRSLVATLAERLPRAYLPRYYEVVPSLPRTSTGKVNRDEARRLLRTAPMWDHERSAWGSLDALAGAG